MTIWFTSDSHFGHDKDFIYQARGFNSIQEHDEAIIERWNSVVKPDDTVYHLGDAMMGRNYSYGINCLRRLNGTIYIIRGNHDTVTRWEEYEDQWPHIVITGWSYVLKRDGYPKLYLCHYPTITSCLENDKPLKNQLLSLHGHTHSKKKFEFENPYMYNVALDAHDCYPISIDEVVIDIEKRVEYCRKYK